MKRSRKITGIVFSDLGRASSFMALDWVQRSFKVCLGFAPYPATLNLRVNTETDREGWKEMRALPGKPIVSPEASFCPAKCLQVKIGDEIEGGVIVPDVRDYPEDKIEVVAPVRLKDALKLKDGDRLSLEFVDSCGD